jgi:hypothetical protein
VLNCPQPPDSGLAPSFHCRWLVTERRVHFRSVRQLEPRYGGMAHRITSGNIDQRLARVTSRPLGYKHLILKLGLLAKSGPVLPESPAPILCPPSPDAPTRGSGSLFPQLIWPAVDGAYCAKLNAPFLRPGPPQHVSSRPRLSCRLRRRPVHTKTQIRPTSTTSSKNFSLLSMPAPLIV